MVQYQSNQFDTPEMITNICIKNPCQRSRIFHTTVVKYVVYKRRWFIRNERMGKHGIWKILASSMFIYIQEVNIVISQQICNFFLCLNLRQTLQYIIIKLFDITIRWPVYNPNKDVLLFIKFLVVYLNK